MDRMKKTIDLVAIDLVETVVDGKRLGRHVRHDPRSLEYPAAMASGLVTVRHERHVPVFDQGSVGSCTGNAEAGCVSTGPFTQRCDEKDARALYAAATHLDNVKGVYPPNDTGSSGLAVMKVAKNLHWINGYTHAFSLTHALHALVLGPGITGLTWLTGCDAPDAHGVVRYEGSVRGGHEVELVGLDVAASLVWFANSWGSGWGLGGFFAMSFDDYAKALADNGDATFPVVP